MEILRNKVRENRNKGDTMNIGYIKSWKKGEEWR